jgi:hypothetical protein
MFPPEVWCPNPSCPLGKKGIKGGLFLQEEIVCGGATVGRYKCKHCGWNFTYKPWEQDKLERLFNPESLNRNIPSIFL